MKWEQLLCEKRKSGSSSKKNTDPRNEFQKDYHRIICSASYRIKLKFFHWTKATLSAQD